MHIIFFNRSLLYFFKAILRVPAQHHQLLDHDLHLQPALLDPQPEQAHPHHSGRQAQALLVSGAI